MTNCPHLFVALPVMDEPELLPFTLDAISSQNFTDFTVVICVNQPDEWWDLEEKLPTCLRNRETLEFLQRDHGFKVLVLDRSSRGQGWKRRSHGVGWARKTLMDSIVSIAHPQDIILSLDADTVFPPTYFESVIETLTGNPGSVALAVPYYHHLPDDPITARAILRYEIYMRHYVLNLWRIGSPYSFTALGSAMAFPVWAYRAVGGITPKLSGEDFYFLQKLRKFGDLHYWNGVKVHPAARDSSRVYFGTGPAMIRGAGGNWSSYPIYPYPFFDEIGESCTLFPEMFRQTRMTPVTRFLSEVTGDPDPFASLRKNSRDRDQFVRACHEKFDGLRILQYLKQQQKKRKNSDEENFVAWLEKFHPGMKEKLVPAGKLSFEKSAIQTLNRIRDFLTVLEDGCRISSGRGSPGQPLPAG
ncbi:MAG: glycosyltransferase [bacterium]